MQKTGIAAACRALIVPVAVLAALAGAPSASAHAILQETTPSNDSVVQRSPATVKLRFNEPVETAFGSIRVFDCAGTRVDAGKITRPDAHTVSIALGGQLPRGSYTATWRVISADAHPVSGAFVFHVKAADKSGSCKPVFGKGAPRAVDVLFKAARAIDFALLLLVAGGSAALALVLRSAAADLRLRFYGALTGLALGLVLAAILSVVLQGGVAGGFGLNETFRWNTVDAVLQTRFGEAFLLQIGFAAATAVLAFMAWRSKSASFGPVVLVPAALLLPTVSAAGHARTSGTVAFVADVTHITAASVWVGGLAFTVVALLRAGEDRWPLASRAVPVFSRLAVLSVVTLIIAGSIRGYQEIRAWHGLWETTYGLLLVTKVGLVLPLLALGAYNNRYAVPRLRKQIASLVEQRRFLRAAGAELAIMAVIVGVTAVLVTEPPAKASIKPPKFVAATVPIGALEVNYVIDPARSGPNVIHLYFFDKTGVPANVAEAKLSASLASKNLGPLRFQLQRIVPSHYTVSGATFPIPGDWQLTIEARRGQFQSLTTTVSVAIRKS